MASYTLLHFAGDGNDVSTRRRIRFRSRESAPNEAAGILNGSMDKTTTTIPESEIIAATGMIH